MISLRYLVADAVNRIHSATFRIYEELKPDQGVSRVTTSI